MQFHYSGTFVNTSSILIADDEFMETSRDNHCGTDMFDFPFNTKQED
jgi:hypothetical protein